jgi:UDP-GlcNAc3NAcA epimerase
VIQALGRLGAPVLFPAHPRTRAVLAAAGAGIPVNVTFCEPLGYHETLGAARDAALVITDSGGLQREAYWLGTSCVTLRDETEWTETLDAAANTLIAPTNPERLVAVATELLACRSAAVWDRDAYGIGDAATRVADALAGSGLAPAPRPATEFEEQSLLTIPSDSRLRA